MFIEKNHCTEDGEIADQEWYSINTDLIAKEATYDGFYAVCTNLEDDAPAIIRVNKRRWEIEECFRIMKSEFKARPVYLSLDDRIEAHFMTCFLSLVIYRLLEKKLNEKFTCQEMPMVSKLFPAYNCQRRNYITQISTNQGFSIVFYAFVIICREKNKNAS